jgi:hypothetical protein
MRRVEDAVGAYQELTPLPGPTTGGLVLITGPHLGSSPKGCRSEVSCTVKEGIRTIFQITSLKTCYQLTE